MKFSFKSVSLVFAATVLTAVSSFGIELKEESVRGTSPLAKGNDFMSLIVKKDLKNEGSYYMILAEYTLKDLGIGKLTLERLTPRSNELALASWIPRMYIYRADKISDMELSLKPLIVNANGDIVVEDSAQDSRIKLTKENSLENAVLIRANKATGTTEEVVKFNKERTLHGNSTWEPYVSGMYFGTKNNTGGDYFKKTINTELTADRIAKFNWDGVVKGNFDIIEKLPGMFVMKARDNSAVGKDEVEGKIVVFVDIVNWKSFGIDRFTTEEMLIIDSEDATKVGFFYERHYNLKDEEEKNAKAKKKDAKKARKK